MSDLTPYEPAPSPEHRPAPVPAPSAPPASPGGDGPRELWRRANAATRGTVIGVLVALLVAASFAAGRLTAPDGGGDAGPDRAADAPAETALSAAELARARTDDDAAKRVARDLVTFVESCAAVAADGDYSRCRTTSQLNVGSTLPLVDGSEPGRGEAAIAASRDGFRVVSVSASGNSFTLAEEGTGQPVRTCTDGGAKDAGCVGGVW
ncbi:unannotated protein [freshwater metagenome]|uniref:Unannotated protein n=1 Tax=freshwater metagenome TaxID=449393 RepID=A0A6J7H2C1_9ZZZZ|nr:hypothetical protein [Actinomycetota bacterium]